MDTETTCHCGADYQGSDHCPACGCEQYEGGCDHRAALRPHAGPQPLEAEVLSTLSRTPASRSRTVYDPAGNVYYEPFISDDGRVGYRVGRTDERSDAETFIYLNPSTTEGDDTPNVFLYIGVENDPAEDQPQHFYTLTAEEFGIEP